MQGIFAESSLRKQAWRNPKEGRVGCLHQNIFTRKVTGIAFTSDFFNNHYRPRVPYVPVPHVPASHTCCPQVARLASPSPQHAFRCPRPTFIHSQYFCTYLIYMSIVIFTFLIYIVIPFSSFFLKFKVVGLVWGL